jgi:hypothetical protein
VAACLKSCYLPAVHDAQVGICYVPRTAGVIRSCSKGSWREDHTCAANCLWRMAPPS